VSLSWDGFPPRTFNSGCSKAVQYEVEKKIQGRIFTSAVGQKTSNFSNFTGTNYTVASLEWCQSYVFRTRAKTYCNGLFSPILTVRTRCPPPSPPRVTLNINNCFVNVSWQFPRNRFPVNGYKIELRGANGQFYPTQWCKGGNT
jgi:hypothetical protein